MDEILFFGLTTDAVVFLTIEVYGKVAILSQLSYLGLGGLGLAEKNSVNQRDSLKAIVSTSFHWRVLR